MSARWIPLESAKGQFSSNVPRSDHNLLATAPDLLRERDPTRFRADLWLRGETMTTIALADDHHIVREGFRALLESEPDFAVVGEAAIEPTSYRNSGCMAKPS